MRNVNEPPWVPAAVWIGVAFSVPWSRTDLPVWREEPLEGIALILRAIDVTIANVEARDDIDSCEQLATLRYMRERWREKAAEEARAGGDASGLRGGESCA